MISEVQVKTSNVKESESKIKKGVAEVMGTETNAETIASSKLRCIINGKLYNSFREAANDIDKNKLTAAEVERRCLSRKIKYKDWNIESVSKTPLLKISLDGVLFESPIHASKYIKMTPTEIRNRIYSNNPMYRHWKELDTAIENVSYEENEMQLKNCNIREALPTIKCEGKQFFSIKEAAISFGVTDERIRQKLVSDKYTDYVYIT
jgi:hypothetical protein